MIREKERYSPISVKEKQLYFGCVCRPANKLFNYKL